MGLRADVLAMSTHFFVNPLLKASLAHFPRLYLFWAYWPTFLPRQPILPPFSLGLLGPFATSLPLFTPMGLLLNSQDFLGPFTTLLPLISFLGILAIKPTHWVYQFILWASLAHLVLFNSYYSHMFIVSVLGLSRPIYSFFTSFHLHGPAGHQSRYFNPLGLFPYFFTILPLISFSPSLLLDFFCCWALCKNERQ